MWGDLLVQTYMVTSGAQIDQIPVIDKWGSKDLIMYKKETAAVVG